MHPGGGCLKNQECKLNVRSSGTASHAQLTATSPGLPNLLRPILNPTNKEKGIREEMQE